MRVDGAHATSMPLRGRSVLIVDSYVTPRVMHIQAAIDMTGAESVVARDAAAAMERCRRFAFAAAVINREHQTVAEQLDIPHVLYRHETPHQVVRALLHELL